MDSTYSFLLNKEGNKKSVNKNTSINLDFSGNKKILPGESVFGTVNAHDIYDKERRNSNKFRLIFNINSVCSNVLFNPFTEIIKNEGSSNVVCLNFTPLTSSEINNNGNDKKIIGKRPDFNWTTYDAIRDTQISNPSFGFDYHCGIDIFNNHIIRNQSFKAVNYSNKSEMEIKDLGEVYGSAYTEAYIVESKEPHKYVDDNFNTIDDYARDKFGVIIQEEKMAKVYNDKKNHYIGYRKIGYSPVHLYNMSNVYTFKNCIENKLIEKNGWYGFSNASLFSFRTISGGAGNIVDSDTESVDSGNAIAIGMEINKALNNKKNCEFIDLYPGRDLYSFVPKYNKHQDRLEYNWNYCLTYPSESIIGVNNVTFDFFVENNGKAALKALMIDEYTVNDNGVNVLTVYSICKHGLNVGDNVNIYKSYVDSGSMITNLLYESAEVLNIVDAYIFQVAKTEANISDKWLELTNIPKNYIYTYSGKTYNVCESKRVNVDPKSQNIFFKKVVDGIECEYYVRKFSRIPNFKFKDEDINDYTLYDIKYNKKKKLETGKTLLERFSDPSNTHTFFDSHLSKLGFSANAYGDDNAEIVFTDDIDVSYLKDNLGRPLSDIYLTVIKNNKGYKQWYGIGEGENWPNSIKGKNVEYSHCFGKINSSFLLSEYYRKISKSIGSKLYDVRDLDSVNGKGLTVKNMSDEINFNEDYSYYGDICCYSPADCEEDIIQKAMHRFNTVQREIGFIGNAASRDSFSKLATDEFKETMDDYNILARKAMLGIYYIPNDLYDYFKNEYTEKHEYKNLTYQREGYYYQPHYRIPIKTVSNALSSSDAIKYNFYKVEIVGTNDDENTIYEFKTIENNDFCLNEKLILYKRSTNEYFYVTVLEVLTSQRFRCIIEDKNGIYINSLEGLTYLSRNTNELAQIQAMENYSNTLSEMLDDFVILKKHSDAPSYAVLAKDGSCKFIWREIIANGYEDEETIYPFTNGAFYITQQINFFLRRQDPTEENMYEYCIETENESLIPPKGEFIETTPNIETDFYETNIEPC